MTAPQPPHTSDVIIVGAGHNGLTAAAYLARAGLSVTVLEARDVVGGASVTEQVFDDLLGSTCAFTVGLLRPEVIADLELERHGLELYHGGDALTWTIEDSGRDFVMWSQVDATLREVTSRFGKAEAQGFMELGLDLQRVGDILTPLLLAPAISLDDLAHRFESAKAGQLFDRFVLGSVRDVVDRYFTDPLLKGHFAYPGMVSFHGGPSTPGSAYVLAHHSVGEFQGQFGQWGWARGGMGAISDALAGAALSRGARILTGRRVTRLTIIDGRVTGVVTTTGEEFRAATVVSNIHPTATMTELVDPDDLDHSERERYAAIDNRGSMARVFLATDSLPEFDGVRRADTTSLRAGHMFLGPELDSLERAAEAQDRGLLPERPPIEAVIEGVRDQRLRSGSRYLITTGVQQLPSELSGRTWAEARGDLEKLAVDRRLDFAPGMRGHILDVRSLTPHDLATEYGLTGGNIYHGAMNPDQLVAGRSPHRTAINGLYLCGAGTHPGGGVMGANGYNGAMAVLSDRRLPAPRPWSVAEAPTITRLTRSWLSRAYRSPIARGLITRMASSPALRPMAKAMTRRRSR